MVREQLARLGGLTDAEIDALGVRVEALPGGPLGWRSRVRYAVDAADRAGLLKHRSHEVVPIDRCLIAHPAIQELPVLAASGARWPAADAVETVASHRRGRDRQRRRRRGAPPSVTRAGRRSARWPPDGDWTLPASAFWQVHPAAADTLSDGGAGRCSTRGRASRPGTSTAGPGCSPPRSPTGSARPAG